MYGGGGVYWRGCGGVLVVSRVSPVKNDPIVEENVSLGWQGKLSWCLADGTRQALTPECEPMGLRGAIFIGVSSR